MIIGKYRKWLPAGLDVVEERIPLGRLTPRVLRVRDPGELIDSVDQSSFGPDERFPYWSEIWPSAVALGRFISRGRNLAGLETLELGSGMGLAGVAAALRGAEVLFSDYEPDALAFSRVNHGLNLGRPGMTRLFDWRDPPRKLSARLVIASDVLYEKRFLDPFLTTLGRLLVPGGMALVAEPGRKIADGAVERLESMGMKRALALEEFTMNLRPQAVWVHTLVKPARH